MTPQAIITFAKWQVKKDSIEAVLNLLPELIKKSIAEEGNSKYKIYRSDSEANLFIFFEAYRDEQSLEAHRNSSHNSILKLVFFDYQPGRNKEAPRGILSEFKGHLQTDG